jgi:hypothetical protein
VPGAGVGKLCLEEDGLGGALERLYEGALLIHWSETSLLVALRPIGAELRAGEMGDGCSW